MPKIIARDEKYIAEEWIEGVSGNQVEEITLISAIGSLLEKFKTDFTDLHEDKRFKGSFDYLGDYLIDRIDPWLGYCNILEIKEDWQNNFFKVKNQLSDGLSHLRTNPSNVIRSKDGKIFVIDNELVGVGLGWIWTSIIQD